MSQEKKQSLVSRITPAGWLALVVVTIFIVGVVGNLVKAAVPYNRLQTVEPVPTYTPTPAPTTTPELDTDAAWETFIQVINKCDALADQGDDLSKYPQSLEEATKGIEELTTDQTWIEHCQRWGRTLAEFGPQNLSCKGNTCTAAVSVKSIAGVVFVDAWCKQTPNECEKARNENPDIYAQRVKDHLTLSRPPLYVNPNPLRLLKGTVEYQEGRWIVTKIQIDILPASPDSTATPQP